MQQNKPQTTRLFAFRLIALSVFLFFSLSIYGSHNIAGQITFIKLGANTYEFTLTTYTDPAPMAVDRCEADFVIYNTAAPPLELDRILAVPRINGPFSPDPQFPGLTCGNGIRMGEYILGTIKKNIYKFTYTFSGPGNFYVTYTDPARWDDIVNMLNPGNTEFHLSTLVRNNPALGANNSPSFLNDPLDFACTGKFWTHNPGGYDQEGDSLSYRLIANKKGPGLDVDGYQYPNAFGGNFWMDAVTGMIYWDTPQQVGAYNIAFLIEEWRNGLKIGEAIRDMVIFVRSCNNDPPIIQAITDTCIQAGDTLILDFKSWDPNPGDSLYLSQNHGNLGNNGPPMPPMIINTIPGVTLPVATTDTVFGQIIWPTTCLDVRKSPWQIDLYAHDNFNYYNPNNPTQMLSANHIIQIRVTAPPVTGLVLTPAPHQVNLNWDFYNCPGAIGYHVYRRIGGGISLDTVCCGTDPVTAGFTRIHSSTTLNQTSYTDDLSGFASLNGDICYVVLAYFAQNQLSCPSRIECIELSTGNLRMTNASVLITDPASGDIFVRWTNVDTSQINTVFFPGPYTYNLFRANEITGNQFVRINPTPIVFGDTSFIETSIDTDTKGNRYFVQFNDPISSLIESNQASSIYLKTFAGEKQITLIWEEYVPWTNFNYEVYRADDLIGPYVLIANILGTGANTHSYVDTGLVNFEEYCYFIRSYGNYDSPNDFDSLLINDSERRCDTPRDTTPPCVYEWNVDTTSSCTDFTVSFTISGLDTLCSGDLDYYTFFISDKPDGNWTEIGRFPANDTAVFSHTFSGRGTIADCYGVSATDTLGNQSKILEYCFDNCPTFEFGNVFSPNGDGNNDFWSVINLNFRSVIVTKIQIFDRWGTLIYSKEGGIEPQFLWNGVQNNGKPAAESVYYYIIEFEDERLGGNLPKRKQAGYLTLMR